MKCKRFIYILLCTAVLFSALHICGFAASDQILIPGARLDGKIAVVGQRIEAPMLAQNDDANFRIVRYQWYRGEAKPGCEVAIGDPFADDRYYLDITIRLRDASRNYIQDSCYLSCGSYTEVARTVDPDGGSVHTCFSVAVHQNTSAQITLPSVAAGDSMRTALQETAITSPEAAPTLVTLMVYENDTLLTVAGFNAKGEFVWTGEDRTFQEGSVYKLTGLAVFDGWYVAQEQIVLKNPALCDKVTVAGDESGVGFTATYTCKEAPSIAAISIEGVTAPTAGSTPDFDGSRLVAAQPEYYTAAYWTEAAWRCDGAVLTAESTFSAGNTYQVSIAISPLPGVRGLNEKTAALLPVRINGVCASFDTMPEENCFVYTAEFTLPPVVAPMPFTDVQESDWFYSEVEFCYRNELMNGTGATQFQPLLSCTRAMIVAILYRLEGSPDVRYTETFQDVPDQQWFTDGIIWAAQNGIVNGYGNGKFGPGDEITREQLATILLRYTRFHGAEVSAQAGLSAYPDADCVHPWALDAVRWAVATGLINGKSIVGTTYLQPQGEATRAECAAILMRYCNSQSI